MRCRACDYENPPQSERCLECGIGLVWTQRGEAQERLREELLSARRRATARLARASQKGQGADR